MFTAKLTEVSFAQECFGVNGGKGLKVGHTLKKLKVGHALGKSCVRQRDAV